MKLYFFKNHQINISNFVIFFILNILFIIFAYTFREWDYLLIKDYSRKIIFTSSAFYIYLVILYINQKFKIN